jgi:hypothetical protein
LQTKPFFEGNNKTFSSVPVGKDTVFEQSLDAYNAKKRIRYLENMLNNKAYDRKKVSLKKDLESCTVPNANLLGHEHTLLLFSPKNGQHTSCTFVFPFASLLTKNNLISSGVAVLKDLE